MKYRANVSIQFVALYCFWQVKVVQDVPQNFGLTRSELTFDLYPAGQVGGYMRLEDSLVVR